MLYFIKVEFRRFGGLAMLTPAWPDRRTPTAYYLLDMLRVIALLASCLSASAFQLPKALQMQAQKLAAPALAAAVTLHSEAAHAKSVLGVNGALDFGPLAGDQPGGEGTGKVNSTRSHEPSDT